MMGDITTGTKVQSASESTPAAGGMVVVDKPADALDGSVINVPDKAYPGGSTFNVSYVPITNQAFGDDINPVSSMISGAIETAGAIGIDA